MHSECQIKTLLTVEDVADYAPLFTDSHTVWIPPLSRRSFWERW